MATPFVFDGTTDFLGGQDASKAPARVPPNAYYSGVNVQISRGDLGPRWGFVKRPIVFPSGGVTLPESNRLITYANIFHSGRFQALIPYTISGVPYLIIIVSGIIFLVNQNNFIATIVTIVGGGNLNENTPRLNWSNAGQFLVIFDYPNFPIIFDGVSARRADPALYEVPVSTLGAYNQNRLFIANAGNEFTGGDPAGNQATPNAPITFEEVLAPASSYLNQFFQLPTNYINDPITAMGFLQVIDTSTGIGPLLVATKNAIYSYQTQNPRSTWEAGTFGSVFVANAGIAGARSLVNVNSDLFFLSGDGQVRSASMSRDEQGRWARVPISKEVENWLKFWDPSLMPFTVMGYFQNKIFISANPFRVNSLSLSQETIFDVAHGGLVVIALDNLATLSQQGSPAWDGLWTGVYPMDIATTTERCFIMSKDPYSRNELYEVDPTITYDKSGPDVRYARAIVYTKEYSFETPFQNKSLHSLDLGVRDVQGDFKIDVFYKPSHGTRFVKWADFQHIAPWRTCGMPQSCEVNGFAAHQFKNLVMGQPVDFEACDPVGRLLYNEFRKAQVKFVIEGKKWAIQDYKLKATISPQSERETYCEEYQSVVICSECNSDDWTVGAFKSCQTHQT